MISHKQIATLVTHGYTDRDIKPNYFVNQHQVVVVLHQHLTTTAINYDDIVSAINENPFCSSQTGVGDFLHLVAIRSKNLDDLSPLCDVQIALWIKRQCTSIVRGYVEMIDVVSIGCVVYTHELTLFYKWRNTVYDLVLSSIEIQTQKQRPSQTCLVGCTAGFVYPVLQHSRVCDY